MSVVDGTRRWWRASEKSKRLNHSDYDQFSGARTCIFNLELSYSTDFALFPKCCKSCLLLLCGSLSKYVALRSWIPVGSGELLVQWHLGSWTLLFANSLACKQKHLANLCLFADSTSGDKTSLWPSFLHEHECGYLLQNYGMNYVHELNIYCIPLQTDWVRSRELKPKSWRHLHAMSATAQGNIGRSQEMPCRRWEDRRVNSSQGNPAGWSI